MIIEKPDPNIFIFKNFITEEESAQLLDIALNATEDEWSQYNYTERHENDEWENRILLLDKCSKFDKDKNKITNNIFDRIKKEIKDLLNKDIYEYVGFKGIYRSIPGQEMKTHSDQGLGVKFKYGIVLYLNDNYSGGEIYYPNVDVKIKPEACSLVLHPAHEAYRHGVKQVSLGTRYSMTVFVKLK
jgi:hypothetical protein